MISGYKMKHADILEIGKIARFCVYVFFLFSGFHSMVNNWNNDNMLLFNIGIWCLLFVVCALCFYSCEGYAHWMSLSLNDTVEITLDVGLSTNLEINTYKKNKTSTNHEKKTNEMSFRWNCMRKQSCTCYVHKTITLMHSRMDFWKQIT